MNSDATELPLVLSVLFGTPVSFLFVTAALMKFRAGIEAANPPRKPCGRQVSILLVLVIQVQLTFGLYFISVARGVQNSDTCPRKNPRPAVILDRTVNNPGLADIWVRRVRSSTDKNMLDLGSFRALQ